MSERSQITKADLRTETVALLAASYGFARWYNPAWKGPASQHPARQAVAEVTWAEKVGRLPQLHAKLADGAGDRGCDVSAPKTAAELRTGLKQAIERMQSLRDGAVETRDRYSKNSDFWSLFNAEVRAYNLSLHVLLSNTSGEFGEDLTVDGAR
ncbi:hypothetical protein [Amycolatopsis japonica]